MDDRRPRGSLPLLLSTAGLIGGVAGYAIRSSQWMRPVAPRTALSDPIVERAIALYGHGKISLDRVRKSNDINVVYLPTMTCVGFNPLPGTVGGGDTVCLDKSGQRIVLAYMNGQ